ncbi:MAG: hypothetical protein ABW166_06130 [Sedimenticola sp.]
MKQYSLLKALVIAPITAPIIYYIGTAVVIIMSPETTSSFLSAFAFVMFFGIPVSYIATVIIGVPVYKFLDMKGALSKTNLVLCGSVLGAVVLVLFFSSMSFGGMEIKEILFIAVIGAALGASVAFSFGLIAGITRPSSGYSR